MSKFAEFMRDIQDMQQVYMYEDNMKFLVDTAKKLSIPTELFLDYVDGNKPSPWDLADRIANIYDLPKADRHMLRACILQDTEDKRITWKNEIKDIKQCPQRQDSVTAQLLDLIPIASKLGFYDAADYIRRTVDAKAEAQKAKNPKSKTGMTEKEAKILQVLTWLYNQTENPISPTMIGQQMGKNYVQASGYCSASLKRLVELGFVTRTSQGHYIPVKRG